MLKILKPLLPDWRWWPGVCLASLFFVAGIGFASPIPPLQKQAVGQRGEKPGDKPQKVDPNERLADYTLLLMIFTGALAGVGLLQIRLLYKADKTARLSLGLVEKQIAITATQTDILAQQKEIARRQFLAEHRPKLVLKDVFFSDPNSWDKVTFELSNIGGSEAKVTGGFVAIGFITDPRQFKDMRQGSLGSVESAVFGAGNLRQFSRDVSSDIRDHVALEDGFYGRFPDARRIGTPDAAAPPEGTLFFFGALLYVDGRGEEFGIQRLSAFRREWKNSSFQRTENPDHEYAD